MAIFPRVYDFVLTRAESRILGQLRRRVVAPARGRVVEIGAGTGLDFTHYRDDVWVAATDPDIGMLARARDRSTASRAEVVLVAADAQQMPFRTGVFDEAVVGLAMCTIPRPDLAVVELRRILRHGGIVRLLEHVRLEHPLWGRLQDTLTPLWRRVAGGCHLNRRPAAILEAGGLVLDSVQRDFGGVLQTIVAHTPGDEAGGSVI